MPDAGLTESRQLLAISTQLRKSGNKVLRKEMLAAIRKATQPVPPALKAAARTKLPSRGGLAAIVAKSKITRATKTGKTNAGVQIRAVGKVNVRALDAGRLRHPVFGKGTWVQQQVTPHWWTDVIDEHSASVTAGVKQAMNDIARTLERGR